MRRHSGLGSGGVHRHNQVNFHIEPAIDRSIYVMPMFINLVVNDLAAAEKPYTASGFETLATIPGPGGEPSLVHLRRERY